MHFRDFLHNSAKEIDTEIEVFFSKWSKDVEHISPRLLPLIEALYDACRGGKRIRGALVKMGYEIGRASRHIPSGKNPEIIKIAVAYEIFQAAILAHDDIIDKSETRRGKPSLYVRLGGGHEGIAKAICLGDIGFFLAFKIISESDFSEAAKNQVLTVFSNTMLETGLGELLDVELSNKISPGPSLVKRGIKSVPSFIKGDKGGFLLDDIISVYTYKTAYYTIVAPLLIGSILAGVEDERLEKIKIFGRNLGIAFQILDDVNDIFSTKRRLGKEMGGDIREGKQTLLYVYAREHVEGKEKKILEKYYGNSSIGRSEIEEVKKVFEESGALEYASGEARKYAEEARNSVAEITKNETFREMLLEMTEYFIKK